MAAALAAAALAAAAAIAGNDDLIWEILSRLPPKSLIRFKIVCKSWMSLISSPAFIADHTRRRHSSPAISDLVLLALTRDEATNIAFSLHDDAASLLPDPSLFFINLPHDPPHHSIHSWVVNKIWNSCNGLLLFTSKTKTLRGRRSRTAYRCWVVNPTTMELKETPPLPPMMRIAGAGVVFDPSTEPHHYRVVCFGCRSPYSHYTIHNMNTPQPFEFATYYSETGAWGLDCKTTCNMHPGDVLYSQGRGVFWNGMLNWVSRNALGYGSVVSFDAERQLMHMTPLPVLRDGVFRFILSFNESGGRLLLIESHNTTAIPNGSEQMRFNVMELGAQLSGWSLLYRVDLASAMIENLFPEIYDEGGLPGGEKLLQLYPVLVVLQGKEADDDVLLLSVPGKIVAYCLGSKTFRVVRVVPTKEGSMLKTLMPWDVFTYTHTLFSP